MPLKVFGLFCALLLAASPSIAVAQPPESETLFQNVRVFDGSTPRLSEPTSVLAHDLPADCGHQGKPAALRRD
jgi:hypothetical protein